MACDDYLRTRPEEKDTVLENHGKIILPHFLE
jgi:hypothetical protein